MTQQSSKLARNWVVRCDVAEKAMLTSDTLPRIVGLFLKQRSTVTKVFARNSRSVFGELVVLRW